MKTILLIASALLMPLCTWAQPARLTLDEAVRLALEKHPAVLASALERDRQAALKPAAIDIPKTDVTLMKGQYNSIQKNDNNITITQTLPFPTVLHRQAVLSRTQAETAGLRYRVTRSEMAYQVRQVFVQLLYLQARAQVLAREDSIMKHLQRSAELQYKTGEANLLVQTAAQTQALELGNQIGRNEADRRSALQHLQLLCQEPALAGVNGDLETLSVQVDTDSAAVAQNPTLALSNALVTTARWQKKVDVARTWPDIRVGYFNQTLIGTQTVNGQDRYFGSSYRFQGFEVGLAIPLWFSSHAARIRAATIGHEAAQKQADATRTVLQQQHLQARADVVKNTNSLAYYRQTALNTAGLLERQSLKAFDAGEINLTTHLLNLRQALSIREGYLDALHQYHQSNITLHYLNGNKE
jgi:cobalt-zinc-cadmium resistance protein CzcA